MAINRENETGVARDGDKAEPVAVLRADEKPKRERPDLALTVSLVERSQQQEERFAGHQDSDPCR